LNQAYSEKNRKYLSKFKNKKAAAFGCYGWSGESVKILKEKLADAGFDYVPEEEVEASYDGADDEF